MGDPVVRRALLNIFVDFVVLGNAIVLWLEIDRVGFEGKECCGCESCYMHFIGHLEECQASGLTYDSATYDRTCGRQRCGKCEDNGVPGITLTSTTTAFLDGQEGQDDDQWAVFRYAICIIYVAEMAIQLICFRKAFLTSPLTWLELPVVLVAAPIVFAGDSAGDWQKVWRITVLRCCRYTRIWEIAENSSSLRDLWLVLVGMAHAARAIVCLGVIFLACLYACAGAATGLSLLSSRDQEDCTDEQAAIGACLDKDMYFGSVVKSGLTLFQCITLDGWAQKVVRPLWQTNPITATSLSFFSIAMAYGLVSVSIGCLVWSTINLARRHGSHSSQVEVAHDFEIIASLRQWFDNTLHLTTRRMMIGKREWGDAMAAEHVKKAIKQLDLPEGLGSPEELFRHLDRDRCGEFTAAEFQKRMQRIQSPHDHYDIACLIASVGGSVTYVGRMEKRGTAVVDNLRDLKERMRTSFQELHHLTRTDDSEVMLRKQGIIYNPIPPGPPRFTEGAKKAAAQPIDVS